MYFPYLYGRRSELLAARAVAKKIAVKNKVIPVIEPVKEDAASLGKTIEMLVKEGVGAFIITNPQHGDFKKKTAEDKFKWVNKLVKDYPLTKDCTPAFKITSKTSLADVSKFLKSFPGMRVMLVHWAELSGLPSVLAGDASRIDHLFTEAHTSSVYRALFSGTRVLARDGFNAAERNADYPSHEVYGDLNLTYLKPHSMSGFSDFTITGGAFKDGGGPAHAVAIHLSYERPTKDIGIHHFVSDDTTIPPNNPSLKIGQSLRKLVAHVDAHAAAFTYSDAVKKFQGIYLSGGSCALGTLKQLSIEHHLELMNEIV
jgi:hypothetical protein